MTPAPVLVATDLTEHSEPALVRGRAHADAIGAEWIVCHVIPDVLRHHPLAPTPGQNDVALAGELTKKAADLVTEQVGRVLRVSTDRYRVAIAIGRAEDEIVRLAEAEGAGLVVVGGKPRRGSERYLGHVAERVVRYVHSSVLVARPSVPTGAILVATDFTDGATPAVRFGAMLVDKVAARATLLHVLHIRSAASAVASLAAAFGSPWVPPSQGAIDQLEGLGQAMLEDLAKEHRFSRVEQIAGDPAELIVERASAIGAEMILMGSRGRTGLARLVLGSTAEKVIRTSDASVLIVR